MSNEWINVNEMLPDCIELKKYKVKTVEGSVEAKNEERVILGKMYPTGFRFMTGDWQRVTHWSPSPPGTGEK